MLDSWRLRLLAELAALGTIRAVAESLAMSPSAVSQQLAVLERETRTELLERSGRRVVLTPMGRILAGHARDVLDRIEAAEADLAELGSTPTGVVRLASFASALRALVVPALVRLRGRFPGVHVVTRELEPHESLPALARGEVDLAVVADFGDGAVPVDPQVDRVPLAEDPLVLVLPPDHPVATDGPGGAGLGALAGEHWVLDDPETHLADLVTRLCRRAGFEPEVTGRYRSYGVMLQQIEAGLAVTVLPCLAVDDRYRVVARPLDPAVTRRILAAVRRPRAARPAVRAVLDALTPPGGTHPSLREGYPSPAARDGSRRGGGSGTRGS